MPIGFTDPLAHIDALLADPLTALRPRRAPAQPPIEDDDYDSVLRRLTGAPVSALAWLGETLDKPGRAVRGVLGGHPEELANLIPFSDTLGITSEEGLLGGTPLQISSRENYTSGRDLLRDAGMVGSEDNWGNFLGGLGVEIATDPLTLLSLGTGSATTAAGRIATKAGLMPATAVGRLGTLRSAVPHLDEAITAAKNVASFEGVDAVGDVLRTIQPANKPLHNLLAAAGSGDALLQAVDEPMSALAKYGWGDNAKYFGLGDEGLPIAQQLDRATDYVRNSAPGRLVNKLFNADVLNRSTAVGQASAQEATDANRTASAGARMGAAGILDSLRSAGIDEATWKQIAPYVAEKQWPGNKMTLEQGEQEAAKLGMSLRELSLQRNLERVGKDPTTIPFKDAAKLLDDFTADQRATFQEKYDLGLTTTPGLDDQYAEFAHRQWQLENPDAATATGQPNRAFPTSGPQDMHRKEWTTGVPGGGGLLQDLATDPMFMDDLVKGTEPYDLKELATERQIAALQVAGLDVNTLTDVTKWQAKRYLAELARGTPPEQLTKVAMPPTVAPKPPTKAIETVMQKLDTTPDQGALSRFRELQKVMREGPALADGLKELPPEAGIPQPVLDAFAREGALPEDIQAMLDAGGWDEVARQADENLPRAAVDEMRKALGIRGGMDVLDEATQEEFRGLRDMYEQSRKISRFLATNKGTWSSDVLSNNLKAHISDLQQINGMEAILRHIGRSVTALPNDPVQSQALLDALKAEAPSVAAATTVQGAATPARDAVLSQARAAFGPQADAYMPVMDAHANYWAQQTGKTLDEWYQSKISAIKQSDAAQVGAEALRQSGDDEWLQLGPKVGDDGWTQSVVEPMEATTWKRQDQPAMIEQDAFLLEPGEPEFTLYAHDYNGPWLNDLWAGKSVDKYAARDAATLAFYHNLPEAKQAALNLKQIQLPDGHPAKVLADLRGTTLEQAKAQLAPYGEDGARALAEMVRAGSQPDLYSILERNFGTDTLGDYVRQNPNAWFQKQLGIPQNPASTALDITAKLFLHPEQWDSVWEQLLALRNEAPYIGPHDAEEALWSIRQRLQDAIDSGATHSDIPNDLFLQGQRGAVEFAQDGKALIHAFQAADISTLAHETAHVFRRSLAEASPDLHREAEAALGVLNGQWTREAEEGFATGFEKYLATGQAPTAGLAGAFAKFKDWLTSIYHSIVGTPLEQQLNPQLRAVFDQMLGSKLPQPAVPGAQPAFMNPSVPDQLGRMIQKLYSTKRDVPEGFERVVDAVKNMGLPSEHTANARTFTKLAEQLAESGVLAPQHLAALKAGDANALIALDNLVVPSDVAKDIRGFVGGLNLKQEVGPVLKVWDQITNTLKNHLTVPFPSFSLRNLLSLVWQDGVSGGFTSPMDMVSRWSDAAGMLKGETITGASQWPVFAGRGLTDEQATKLVSQLSFAHGVAPKFASEGLDIAGSGAEQAITQQLPHGQFASGALGLLNEYRPQGLSRTNFQSLNPLNVRGGVSRDASPLGGLLGKLPMADRFLPEANDTSKFFLSKGGEAVTTYMESLGRHATFLRKLAEGYAPEQAAMLSKAVHVDFGKLAPFERDVMKRVAPFYSYTRHALPWQLAEIAAAPGGTIAQSVRATTQSDDGFIPEQAVGAIPLGNEENGTRRFLNLDLPFNVINDVAGGGTGALGTIQQTGYRQLSQLHPLLKAPLELVTGQSFFQRGRPLQDLYSRTGLNNTLADTALMNSPASRYISTGSMLTDNRKSLLDKAVNLATGVRISDVDVAQSRDKAAAKAAMDLLREGGAETFSRMYFPDSYQPTPEEEQLMALLTEQARRRRVAVPEGR